MLNKRVYIVCLILGIIVSFIGIYSYLKDSFPTASISNYAQFSETELNQKLITAKDDRDQIAILLALQQKYSTKQDMPQVLRLSAEIRKLAGPLGDSLSIAKSILPIRGDIDFKEQNALLAFMPGAIAAVNQIHDTYATARLSSSYGTILLHKGEALQSQKYLLYALSVFENADSLHRCVNLSINLGSAYKLIGDLKQAYLYNDKAIQIAKKYKDSTGLASSLMNLGNYYADDEHDYPKAISNFLEAEKYMNSKTEFLHLMNQYNLALALLHNGDLVKSRITLNELLRKFQLVKAQEGIAMVEKGLGEWFYLKGQFQESTKHFLIAIKFFDTLGIDIERLRVRKQFREMLVISRNYQLLKSLTNEIEQLEEKLHKDEKANVYSEMNENLIAQKRKLQLATIRTEKLYQQIGLLFLGGIVVILFFLFRYQRRLVKEKRLSYSVLIKQYRSAQEIKENSTDPDNSDNYSSTLFAELCSYYEAEKPYLDPKLKAQTVAAKMHVRSRDISALLKSKGFNGFNEFTNRFRVEEVKRNLADTRLAHLKIESIALDAGFGSKQTFYSTFEEYTGLNPKYFREEITKS
jgi:methylphosphotriester-DNA--protein-cysteine methyltransferase/uncharacterized protein YozE (UPF0346 family)